ncbi:NPP1 family protein [Paenibacillus sedimenti]|uniref:NPP1 family protein n=1 Tax=Paenibacillus sedimenti TaxID=2770274 RepID=A0A926QJK2_9BACL|nr:NPP1 family protein [Paenibacillus sedimenti]MBD0381806.1 NPP1 family protein [Paenibacillus sedimenti]
MKKIASVLLLSAFVSINLAPTADAAVINHDEVVAILEDPNLDTVTEKAAKRFQPYLRVSNGCVPFPAVDWWGNTSGGLQATGTHNSDCSSSTGQLYVRSGWYNGVWAIMYSWYFPKDYPGHRHDWEAVVVWIDNPANTNPNILQISYSQHGEFVHHPADSFYMSGTHPKVDYGAIYPFGHVLSRTNAQGGTQPLVHWDQISQMARDALNNTDFGAATVPFRDTNNTYWNTLGKAWYK